LAERTRYSIPAASAITLETPGSKLRVGWIRITPDAPSACPAATAVLSFQPNDITHYETGVTAIAAEGAFHILRGSFTKRFLGRIRSERLCCH